MQLKTQNSKLKIVLALIVLAMAALACNLTGEQAVSLVTPISGGDLTPTRIAGGGIPLTDTPTRTLTPTPTLTLTPTLTPTPTYTLTPTPSYTPTNTPTFTPDVITPTAVQPPENIPVETPVEAVFAPTAGWSCGDFPCEDDIAGFMERIGLPPGFALSHVVKLPGQPVSITYGPEGRLYAALITDGVQAGEIVAFDESSGQFETIAGEILSPGGIAFRPGTDILYVTGRTQPEGGGALWSIQPGDPPRLLRDDLPCCQSLIAGQPNGLIFGPDGYLYLAVGARTDHTEAAPNNPMLYATPMPWEGAILRLPPDGSTVEVVAEGFRDPMDLTFTADGQLYVTDSGLFIGVGDRLMRVEPGRHHGWPYWRERGCLECPVLPPDLDPVPDWLTLPGDVRPRGLTAYHAARFPASYFDDLFVALWNGVPEGQRILRVHVLESGQPEPVPFMTGLIRPVDVVVDPDGALVVADYVYGHVWRVTFAGQR